MPDKTSYSLCYALEAIRELRTYMAEFSFARFTDTELRLLSSIEIEAHELSGIAASRKNHPYRTTSYEKPKKKPSHQKLQSAPWRHTPVEIQVTNLILDFGLEETD